MYKIKIGTACSGIGAPEQALKNLGIDHQVEFAIEIDKYARETYLANHDTNFMLEDITKIDIDKLPDVDIFIAGFPCQAFSIAGHRKGFEDTRGTIFFNILDILKHKQPSVFILENVKGLFNHNSGKTFNTIINSLAQTINGQTLMYPNLDTLGYHVFYKVLNATDYGIPQNRERVFIVGFKDFVDYKFPPKQQLTKRLFDLLEPEVDAKYYLSQEQINKIIAHDKKNKDKGNGFKANIAKPEQISSYTLRARYAKGGEEQLIAQTKGMPQGMRIYPPDISVTLLGNSGGLGGKTGLYTIPVLTPDRKNKRQNGRRFKEDGDPMFTITAQDRHGVYDGYNVRKLTPLECFRLMGFPDSFVKHHSNNQLYKQAGNSIVVQVMEALLVSVMQYI